MMFFYSSLFYALLIIGSGLFRYFDAGSQNALWFGLSMGFLSLAGLLFLKLKHDIISLVLQSITVLFVGGFFAVKLFKELEGDSYLRVSALVIASILIGVQIILEIVYIKSSSCQSAKGSE